MVNSAAVAVCLKGNWTQQAESYSGIETKLCLVRQQSKRFSVYTLQNDNNEIQLILQRIIIIFEC